MARKINTDKQGAPDSNSGDTKSRVRPVSPLLKMRDENKPRGRAEIKWLYVFVVVMIVLFSVVIAAAVIGSVNLFISGVNLGYIAVGVVVLLIAFIMYEVAMKPNLYLYRNMEEQFEEGEDPDDRDNEGEPTEVITSILHRDGKILILKRSEKVGTYRDLWAGVSGHMEPGERPEDRAFTEISEETGIAPGRLRIENAGEAFVLEDGDRTWRIHPFLVSTETAEVTLDWEHSEYRWIIPDDIEKYETVPGLSGVVKSLLSTRSPPS